MCSLSGEASSVSHMTTATLEQDKSNNSSEHGGTLLHVAARQDDVELVRNILGRGDIDVGALDDSGKSALAVAISQGAWDVVRVLLSSKYCSNIVRVSRLDIPLFEDGKTELHGLGGEIFEAPDDILVTLNALGVDFCQTDFTGNTILHVNLTRRLGLLHGRTEHNSSSVNIICRLMNVPNSAGQTPLHLAFSDGKTQVAQILMEFGADVNVPDNQLRTPLHYMKITKQNIGKFRETIQHFSPSRSVFGELPPLCWTSITSGGEIAFDINYRDYMGNTALHVLAGVHQRDYKNYIIKLFGDPNAELLIYCVDSPLITTRNTFGETPVHFLSLFYVSKYLLKVVHVISQKDGRGRNYWHRMFTKRVEHLSALTHHPCITNFSRESLGLDAVDELGRTPLHYAAVKRIVCNKCPYEGCSLFSKCCLELFGVDSLYVKDKYGRMPLHYAYMNGHRLTDEILRNLPTEFSEILQQQLMLKDNDGFYPLEVNLHGAHLLSDLFMFIPTTDKREFYDIQWVAEKSRELVTAIEHQCCVPTTSDDMNMSLTNYKGKLSVFTQHVSSFKEMGGDILPGSEKLFTHHDISCGVVAAVNSFMERLVAAIGEADRRLKGRLLAVGSAFEQTRVKAMEEFDFNVELVNVSNKCDVLCCASEAGQGCPPGFVQLTRKQTYGNLHEYREFFNEDGSLCTTKVNFAFQAALVEVLSWQKFWDTEPMLEMKRRKHIELKVDPTRMCQRFVLKFNKPVGGKLIANEISIDVVPVIHIAGWWPEGGREMGDDIKSEGCNFVFDQPYRKHRVPFTPKQYVKISFARAESMLLRKKNLVTRTAYIIAKCVFSAIDDNHEGPTSHVLKSAALWSSIETTETESASESDSDQLRKHVEKLFGKLRDFTVQDYVPCYFLPCQLFPVYTFQKFTGYSHTLLQGSRINYEQLFATDVSRDTPQYPYKRIRQWLLFSCLLHAAFSEESAHISWTYPRLNKPRTDLTIGEFRHLIYHRQS